MHYYEPSVTYNVNIYLQKGNLMRRNKSIRENEP